MNDIYDIEVGDIVIARWANGECYLVKVKYFVPETRKIAVEHCGSLSFGLYDSHEILALNENNIKQIPEQFQPEVKEFLRKKLGIFANQLETLITHKD